MIISEKQIMILLNFTAFYAEELQKHKDRGLLTELGINNLDAARDIIYDIQIQQSTELKELK